MKENAEIMYEAYYESLRKQGRLDPWSTYPWDKLDEDEKECWRAAAEAVRPQPKYIDWKVIL